MNAVTNTADVQSTNAPAVGQRSNSRATAPVFVVGCGRSGTKFLYHTLLSGGGFAVYFAESNAFNLLGVRFGNLARRANRRKLLDAYYNSNLFERTGLKPEEIDERVMDYCRNAGDFLRIVMATIARKQGMPRWAECTPLHLLNLPLIKRVVPDALIIHIIRDGRDVTASLHRIGWIRPFAWDRSRAALVPAIFWRWIVGKGRRYGGAMGGDYLEVHYEDVVQIRAKRWTASASSSSRISTTTGSNRWRSAQCTIRIPRFVATARRLRARPSVAGKQILRPSRFATSNAFRGKCSMQPDTLSLRRPRSCARR